MTDLQPFDFSGRQVRVVTDEHGQPWFLGADVCAVLDISNSSMAIGRLAADERSTLNSAEGGPARLLVSEAGLYRLIFTSRKPEAEAFRRWVTHEVLPAIRRTGTYALAPRPAELTRADLARMVLAAEEELAVVSAALTAAEPAIAYHDRFVASDDIETIKAWGTHFGLTEPQAFDLLRDRKIIYRQCIGERWSRSRQCVVKEFEHRAYAGRQSFAWFDLRPQHNVNRHHNGQVRQTLYVRAGYALDLGKLLGLTGQAAAVAS